jgi:hypothetical protein
METRIVLCDAFMADMIEYLVRTYAAELMVRATENPDFALHPGFATEVATMLRIKDAILAATPVTKQ